MELTAAGRPFLYFPLRGHFEQNHHVAHRLDRHGAGRRMDYDDDGPTEIAAAIAEEIGREPQLPARRAERRRARGAGDRRAAVTPRGRRPRGVRERIGQVLSGSVPGTA